MKTLTTLASLLLFPGAIFAASDIDGYLESTTVAVVQLDLGRMDLPATARYVQDNFPDMFDPQMINGIQSTASGIVQSLRGAGISKVYATMSTMEITSGQVTIIIPCTKPEAGLAPLNEILAMVPESLGYKIHMNEDSIIVATESAWQRIFTSPKVKRDELSRALDQVGSSSLGVSINVREELRSEIIDVFPERVPTGWPIAFSPKAMMENILSLQFAIKTPPDIQAILFANCRDPKGASQVSAFANEAIRKLGLPNLKCETRDSLARIASNGDTLAAMIKSVTNSGQTSVAEMQQSNNLKQAVLGLLNFESVYGGLPPRMTVSEIKKPLLSWRVFLLPFIEQQALYSRFHLDEPWDSPHNLPLSELIPPCYQPLQFPELPLGQTLIQTPLHAGSAWNGNADKLMNLSEITDGMATTICFVVAPKSKAVVWTKPDDLTLGADTLVADLFGDRETLDVAFFDGSIRHLDRKMDVKALKDNLSHADNAAKSEIAK